MTPDMSLMGQCPSHLRNSFLFNQFFKSNRGPLQELEAALVHLERQLSLLLRVHDGQGAAGDYPAGEYSSARGE